MTAIQTPLDRATFLVNAASILTITSSPKLLTLSPPLAAGKPETRAAWDFFGTVAGVGVAFTSRADTVPDADQEALSYAVRDALNNWHPQGYAALVDFLNFVATSPGPAIIGAWIIRNVLPDHQLTPDDPHALSAVGTLFLVLFLHWWEERHITL